MKAKDLRVFRDMAREEKSCDNCKHYLELTEGCNKRAMFNMVDGCKNWELRE